MSLLRCLFLTTLISSTAIQAGVWPTKNTWSPEWESQYATWSKTVWNERFFADSPSPAYRNLSVDCADAVYVKRLIFARENQLPFVIHDPTGGKRLISNEMKRWDAQASEDRRVRAFIGLIQNVGSTYSLPRDTYPAAVTPEAIRGGTVLLTSRENSHAFSVTEISSVGFPILIYASMPATIELFTQRGFPPPSYLFAKGNTPSSKAGFLNFRHPEHLNFPAFRVPGYSEQQYSFVLEDWEFEVQNRLASQSEPAWQRLQRLLDEACARAEDRIQVVNKALDFLAARSPQYCMSRDEFTNYSTPHRDLRMAAAFHVIRKSREKMTLSEASQLAPEYQQVANDLLEHRTTSKFCSVSYAEGRSLSLSEFAQRNFEKRMSSNPHDSLDYRWGEHLEPSGPRALACPQFE